MTDIKKNIKRVIRKATVKNYDVEIVNDEIFITPNTAFLTVSGLKINSKKYPLKGGTAAIPLNEENCNAVMNKKISFEYTVKGKKTTVDILQKYRTIIGESIVLDKKKYQYSKSGTVIIENFDTDKDQLIIKIRKIGFLNSNLTFFAVDQKYNVIEKTECSDDTIRFHEVLNKAGESRIQFFAVDKDEMLPIGLVSPSMTIENCIAEQQRNRVYLADEFEKSYVFPAVNSLSKVVPIQKKSKLITFEYDSEKNQLIANMEESNDLQILLKDMLTDETETIDQSTDTNRRLIPVEKIMNRQIGYFNRKMLMYRIAKESKCLEEGFVNLPGTKKRTENGHVLKENKENRIIFSYNDILILENKECYLTYPEKYAYDFNKGAFRTDFDEISFNNNTLSLHLSVYSLLLPISSITVFAIDYYKKHSYYLDEFVLDKPALTITEDIHLDLKKLRRIFYNNLRLSFRIGVRYFNGYSEEGFICRKPAEYSVKERYIFEAPEEDMICAFYLGENHFNLNMWYSSIEEYQKGVNYQIGRETYYETVDHEAIDPHLILFEANLGKNYTGNPKYLYEYMISHPKYSKFTYVWAYPGAQKDRIPGNPIIVERGSSEYFHYLGKAKYRINNIRFPVPHKKEGMVYLNTWHGTPLKKLGFDIECEGPEKQAFGSLYKESLTWDYMTVDNDYGEDKLVGAFHFEGNVIKKGYPINDIYYDEERKQRVAERLEKAYPIIQKKKVILYAPTWRDLQGDYVRGYEFALPFDLEHLYQELNDKYVILVKLHHLIADNLNIDEKYKDLIINVSNEEDIMELLCKTDILITDYSSVFYDFASARKPMLFYMYDLEEYLNETRGTYVSVYTLPGPIIKTEDDLVKNIKSIDEGTFRYQKELDEFCDEFAKYCHGESSKDVLDIIIDKEDL